MKEEIIKELITSLQYGIDHDGNIDESVFENQLDLAFTSFEKDITKKLLLLLMNTLTEKWDEIESQDSDKSMDKWRSYKRIRNNERDIIKKIAESKGIVL